jgi:hypothetical protein
VTPLAATATGVAATHPPGQPPAAGWLLLAALLGAAVGYAAACWLWPFTDCRRCHGTRKRPSPSGRAFRWCRRCGGTGARLRTGRRVYNYLRGQHQRGTR